MTRLAIIDGIRTPFCKAGTDLKSLPAQELGRIVVSELLERTGFDQHEISQVIFGNVAQPPEAANIARVIALNAGIPQEIPAYTVHRNCASGFEAITSAYEKMAAGEGDAFIVGGTESMSNIPLLFSTRRRRQIRRAEPSEESAAETPRRAPFSSVRFQSAHWRDARTDRFHVRANMGQTAEVLYRDFGIPRENQDAFALESHRKLQRRARNCAKKS